MRRAPPCHGGAVCNVDERCRGGAAAKRARRDAKGLPATGALHAGLERCRLCKVRRRATLGLRPGQQPPLGLGQRPQPCSRSGRTRPPARRHWTSPKQPSAADLCQVVSPAPEPCGGTSLAKPRPDSIPGQRTGCRRRCTEKLLCGGVAGGVCSSRPRWHVCTVAKATAALRLVARGCPNVPVCRPVRTNDATQQWPRQSYRPHLDAPQLRAWLLGCIAISARIQMVHDHAPQHTWP